MVWKPEMENIIVIECLYKFACVETTKRKKKGAKVRTCQKRFNKYELVNSRRQQRKRHLKIMRKHAILRTVWVYIDIQYFTPRLHSNSTKHCIFMSQSFTSDSK